MTVTAEQNIAALEAIVQEYDWALEEVERHVPELSGVVERARHRAALRGLSASGLSRASFSARVLRGEYDGPIL